MEKKYVQFAVWDKTPFYYLDQRGNVCSGRMSDSLEHDEMSQMRNVFPTRELALKAREFVKEAHLKAFEIV